MSSEANGVALDDAVEVNGVEVQGVAKHLTSVCHLKVAKQTVKYLKLR